MDVAGRVVLPVMRSSSNSRLLTDITFGIDSVALVSVPLDGVGFTQESKVGIKRISWVLFNITPWTW